MSQIVFPSLCLSIYFSFSLSLFIFFPNLFLSIFFLFFLFSLSLSCALFLCLPVSLPPSVSLCFGCQQVTCKNVVVRLWPRLVSRLIDQLIGHFQPTNGRERCGSNKYASSPWRVAETVAEPRAVPCAGERQKSALGCGTRAASLVAG